MSGVVAFEGELNSIVKEYLEFNSLSKTSSTFDKECGERGKPISSTDSMPKANQKLQAVQREMMQLYQIGKRKEFFRLWNEYLPETIRNDDAVAQKLEFYLNIYFAIYPLKFGINDGDEGMNQFKNYLETRGASLSQTTEFLPFYALPFVPNPKAHPSYKELFSDKWTPDLERRLQKFLTLALKSTPQPRLFELYKGGLGKDYQNMEQKLAEYERKSNAYLKRYNRVQGDYHNLISITADLVDSLEQTVQGNPVSPEYLQEICLRLFSNQVRQSVDLTRPGTAGEMLRQSAVPPQGLQHSDSVPGSSYDYEKIKHDLTSSDDRSQALLLQALRWKLTKSAPTERDSMMTSYVKSDLLGCTTTGPHKQAVLGLLSTDSAVVRQYTARLFNAFASLAEGRTYLSRNVLLLRALMGNLQMEDGDHLAKENILGCLQKLSLRRQLQSIMIQEGIIAWLVSVLEDNDVLSDYTLEYSVALLMNLCLRSAGKRKCTENAHEILKVLSDLLGHDNQEIIPYVNGTLYSILAIPSIREEAKAMGMEEILRCFIKDDQPDMNRQIEFIIKQLNSTELPDDADSDDEEDEEDEEDQDAMEADLDKSEMVKPQAGELSGDRLLNTHYVNTSHGSARRRKGADNVLGQEDVLRRPITPSHMKSGTENPVVHVQPKSRGNTPFRHSVDILALDSGPCASYTASDSEVSYMVHSYSHPRGDRPPTGRPLTQGGNSSRPQSRDIQRPPTRSGSRPGSSQENTPRPPSVAKDEHASEVVSMATGNNKKLAQAKNDESVRPSQKAMDKTPNAPVNEYKAAFSSRPKIPRTPDVRPTSRGSVGDGPTPQPKYSDSLPTSRPGSGGRPSSSSGMPPQSPSPRATSGSRLSSRSKPR